MKKSDWALIKFAHHLKKPFAGDIEEIPLDLLDDEINMRGIRIQRVKHGEGRVVELNDESDVMDTDFHVSSVDSMYQGGWKDGRRHGKGVEYTNAGMYSGEFQNGERIDVGVATVLDGEGNQWMGNMACPRSHYVTVKGAYVDSLLNGDAFQTGAQHGQGNIRFADGAMYDL